MELSLPLEVREKKIKQHFEELEDLVSQCHSLMLIASVKV